MRKDTEAGSVPGETGVAWAIVAVDRKDDEDAKVPPQENPEASMEKLVLAMGAARESTETQRAMVRQRRPSAAFMDTPHKDGLDISYRNI
jgi:hypothetical protein